ncbi:histone-lysine N-methyltransferase SETMAR [Nephila pilipes]|uniref:Histone-lysine N-methyltransferase SETMAR n=1 Tax=Nephila pilipes TaxID=299642 RepID=A0A8X6PRZ6_NEPPI|nr:histone-lysine N-methyltransferase SETMAR [Nephila pilipes]
MEASGRPSSSRTDINTARVEEIIQRDRRVTVREIASELVLSYVNVQRIVTDELRYSKKHPFKNESSFDHPINDNHGSQQCATYWWRRYQSGIWQWESCMRKFRSYQSVVMSDLSYVKRGMTVGARLAGVSRTANLVWD